LNGTEEVSSRKVVDILGVNYCGGRVISIECLDFLRSEIKDLHGEGPVGDGSYHEWMPEHLDAKLQPRLQ